MEDKQELELEMLNKIMDNYIYLFDPSDLLQVVKATSNILLRSVEYEFVE